MDSETKQCNLCSSSKPLTDFYRYRTGKMYATCKKCHVARTRKRLDDNPARKAEVAWKNRGIEMTWERFEQMNMEQDSKCAICEKPCGSGRRLAVDHNHETGAIRGLLCTHCNVTIGKFESGSIPLNRFLAYLSSS